MSKKGENIYKRKDGRWEGRYIRLYDENGKAKYGYVYGKNYSDVKQRLLEKKAYSGSQADMASKCSALYSEVLDAWLQSTRINIKESTYARYSHLIDTHIRSQLGKYQISKISTQLIEGFIENLLSCGRVDNNGGLSAKTVTDILTIVKSTIDYTNQDSILIKHATYDNNEVLMAIVCDGMGGLSRGEIASAAVIREFEKWFMKELPFELKRIDMNVIGYKWSLLLRSLNISIQEYGQKFSERLGTTFTGTLFINNQFVVVHVGDTRLYHIDTSLKQMTNDHTYVAREVLKGTLTPEQANVNKHRNMLLQCIGASKTVEPQIICGEVKQGVYMLCSDGFRHKVTEEELIDLLAPKRLKNKWTMIKNSKRLIKLIKQRGEKDNISVVVIKPYLGENSKGIKLNFIEKIIRSKTKAYLLATGLLTVSIAIFVIGLMVWILHCSLRMV